MWCNTMGYYAAVKKNEGNHILTNVKRPPNQTINKLQNMNILMPFIKKKKNYEALPRTF